MYNDNEIVILLLGGFVLALIFINRSKIRRLPKFPLCLACYLALSASWLCTVLEGFFMPDFFNSLEHVGYTVSAVCMACWTWSMQAATKDAIHEL